MIIGCVLSPTNEWGHRTRLLSWPGEAQRFIPQGRV